MKKLIMAIFLSPLVCLIWGLIVGPMLSQGGLFLTFGYMYDDIAADGVLISIGVLYVFLLLVAVVEIPYHLILKRKNIDSWQWYVIPISLISLAGVMYLKYLILIDEEVDEVSFFEVFSHYNLPFFMGVVLSVVSMSLLFRSLVYGFSLRNFHKVNAILIFLYVIFLISFGVYMENLIR